MFMIRIYFLDKNLFGQYFIFGCKCLTGIKRKYIYIFKNPQIYSVDKSHVTRIIIILSC